MSKAIPLAFLVAGLIVFALRYCLPGVTATQWTEAQEKEFVAAGDRLHHAAEIHGGHSKSENQEGAIATARETWDRQRAAFDAAKNAGKRNGRILYWTALALFGAGIVSHLWLGRAEQ